MKVFDIASIPGDGIGKETVAAGRGVLDTACEVHGGLKMQYLDLDWNCEYYLRHGSMMPENGLEILKSCDAIFLGAVGFPGVPNHVSLWGLLVPIRREFRQYVNLRPVKQMAGVKSPLADRQPGDIDFLVVREYNEGEYSNMGGRLYRGTDQEVMVQNTIFTRQRVERIIRYGFDLVVRTCRNKVTSATKSNGITYTVPFWDEIFAEVSAEHLDLAMQALDATLAAGTTTAVCQAVRALAGKGDSWTGSRDTVCKSSCLDVSGVY